MRLRLELVVAAMLAGGAIAAHVIAQPSVEPPTREEIAAALDRVAADPNLVPERAVRMLRFKEHEEVANEESWWYTSLQALARWVRGLFAWLAESGRYLVWVLGAMVGVFLVAYLVRLVRGRGVPRIPTHSRPPSYVQNLDIRPESLPEDIGAEAQRLWRSGEERAALALLYRGALSRLVHRHGVPIRASSTEGECVALVESQLASSCATYVGRLVTVWQSAVYGGYTPDAQAVAVLCTGFAAALEHPAGAA